MNGIFKDSKSSRHVFESPIFYLLFVDDFLYQSNHIYVDVVEENGMESHPLEGDHPQNSDRVQICLCKSGS